MAMEAWDNPKVCLNRFANSSQLLDNTDFPLEMKDRREKYDAVMNK
jgi:hypothetical protein